MEYEAPPVAEASPRAVAGGFRAVPVFGWFCLVGVWFGWCLVWSGWFGWFGEFPTSNAIVFVTLLEGHNLLKLTSKETSVSRLGLAFWATC